MNKDNWTQKKQQRFSELAAEINRLKAERDKALVTVGEALTGFPQNERLDIQALWATEHADAIRDALEPFDSGIRATDGAQPEATRSGHSLYGGAR